MLLKDYLNKRTSDGGDGTIVHLRLLPGLVDDYRALVDRALAS